MTAQDAELYATLMEALNLAFPRQALSREAQTKVYWPALADLTVDQVRFAVERAIRSEEFMPAAATLRRLVLGTVEDRAVAAWARVKRAVLEGYGGYRPLTFGHAPLHAAVMAMGGWRVLHSLGFRDAEGVDWATARKEFLQLFTMYETNGVPRGTPDVLAPADARGGSGAPLAVAENPSEILPLSPSAARALPERATDFEPSKGDFATLATDLAKRASAVERRRARPPAVVTRPAPVTDRDVAVHEQRKREALERFNEANGHMVTVTPNGNGTGRQLVAEERDEQ